MQVSRRWSLFGLAAVAIGSLVPVHSYARVELFNTGFLQVASPMAALITTPVVVAPGGGPLSLTLQGQSSSQGQGASQAEGPLEAFAIVTNHTGNVLLADGVSCANPDLSVTLQPTSIPIGSTVRLPLQISASQSATPGTEPVSLSFFFVWPGARAVIGAQTAIVIAPPPAPPPPQSQSSSTVGP